MNAIPKTKLCWNCEGNVSLADENCPYCGVGVQSALLQGYQENFTPPYRLGSQQRSETIPESPFKSKATEEVEEESQEETEAAAEFKKFLITMSLMLSGSVFLIFGVVLALFSKGGVFTLQWNSTYWYAYLILALPLLLFGWNSLQRLDDHDN